jgi:hypothetical protein
MKFSTPITCPFRDSFSPKTDGNYCTSLTASQRFSLIDDGAVADPCCGADLGGSRGPNCNGYGVPILEPDDQYE